jgi:hypothetical protein
VPQSASPPGRQPLDTGECARPNGGLDPDRVAPVAELDTGEWARPKPRRPSPGRPPLDTGGWALCESPAEAGSESPAEAGKVGESPGAEATEAVHALVAWRGVDPRMTTMMRRARAR